MNANCQHFSSRVVRSILIQAWTDPSRLKEDFNMDYSARTLIRRHKRYGLQPVPYPPPYVQYITGWREWEEERRDAYMKG